MDKTGTPGSVKTAAMVSQIILILWAILLLMSSLFQNNIVSHMSDGLIGDSTEKVVLYSAAIITIAASAVYAYAKNHSAPENDKISETEPERT